MQEPRQAMVFASIADGDKAAMAVWFDNGGHVDATIETPLNGKVVTDLTMLMLASAQGHASLVEQLLTHGASVDLQDSDGLTALAYAAFAGEAALVRRLLRAGAQMLSLIHI